MSKAAERIQRAVDLVRKYETTSLRDRAIEHLRNVIDSVRKEQGKP